MPVVRVYVPAAQWRELELHGGDPALAIRGMVANALAGDSAIPESRKTAIPEAPATPKAATPPIPEVRKTTQARKSVRTGLCEHRVAADAYCSRCD